MSLYAIDRIILTNKMKGDKNKITEIDAILFPTFIIALDTYNQGGKNNYYLLWDKLKLKLKIHNNVMLKFKQFDGSIIRISYIETSIIRYKELNFP